MVQLRFETFRSFLKPIEKTSEYPPDSQLNFVFSTSLRSFARMVGSYAKIAFKSSSGVLDVLVREFDVRPITTPEEDLKAILA